MGGHCHADDDAGGVQRVEQQLNRAFYAIALRDTGATPLRLGDIVKVTKNDPQVSNSSNKRNFSLLGDPALQLNIRSTAF